MSENLFVEEKTIVNNGKLVEIGVFIKYICPRHVSIQDKH